MGDMLGAALAFIVGWSGAMCLAAGFAMADPPALLALAMVTYRTLQQREVRQASGSDRRSSPSFFLGITFKSQA